MRFETWNAGNVCRAGSLKIGKPEGKRPLGKPRCRWEDNIRMDLRELGWDVVDWVHMTQDRDQ
jgi:hypothetical protein